MDFEIIDKPLPYHKKGHALADAITTLQAHPHQAVKVPLDGQRPRNRRQNLINAAQKVGVTISCLHEGDFIIIWLRGSD